MWRPRELLQMIIKVSLLLKISQSIKTALIIWNEVDRIPIIIHFGDLSSEKRRKGGLGHNLVRTIED